MPKKVVVPASEFYDEINEEFINTKETTLQLEHSLISLSKWEATWQKPFFSNDNKTGEELLDYIRCMTIQQNIDPIIYKALVVKTDLMEEIIKYIECSMTATWFTQDEIDKQIKKGGRGGSIVTSEIIYYWMTAYQIPFECEKWHLSRLLTLIRVCEEKNKPMKKMSKTEILAKNRVLNDARRRALGSKG